ncbi:hypothetical protein [Citrobacter sp. Marseille-Q6884]|uniref:hypothetical protein n=1 Tax=Citrobacter sp. Marseille-Q6884 TaxID=2956786 RepID=UPI0021B28457|nr:hypothetical protein [Citrobacter sp. Marseille-Q6884]
MTAQEQHASSEPAQCNKEQEHEKATTTECGEDIPASWQLSPQQRAFIDLFAEDDPQE